MDVVEFRPAPEQYAWTFGGVAPTHKIRPGTVLNLFGALTGTDRTALLMASADGALTRGVQL